MALPAASTTPLDDMPRLRRRYHESVRDSLAEQLDLRRFHSASNTPDQSLWQRLKNVPLRRIAGFVLRAGDRRAREARD